MGLILKIIAVIIGLAMVYVVGQAMKKKKMNEVQSVFWLVGAVGIIFMGLFPGTLSWAADFLGVWWPPSILIFFLLVLILFVLFNHAQEISILRAEINELSMQISLIKHEKELLEKELQGGENKEA